MSQLYLGFSPETGDVETVEGAYETLAGRFIAFHQLNPHVFHALHAIASKMQADGWGRGSMKLLFERLRWQPAVKTKGSAYKLNNSFTSLYARAIMMYDDSLDGFFEVRSSPNCDGPSHTFTLAELNLKPLKP